MGAIEWIADRGLGYAGLFLLGAMSGAPIAWAPRAARRRASRAARSVLRSAPRGRARRPGVCLATPPHAGG
jgi:hypothetical protein